MSAGPIRLKDSSRHHRCPLVELARTSSRGPTMAFFNPSERWLAMASPVTAGTSRCPPMPCSWPRGRCSCLNEGSVS